MLGLSAMKSSEAGDLLHVTHGNPQAIAMTLGDLKGGELGLPQVLDGLRGAGDILDHLFMRSWVALASNLNGQQTLLAMSFFAGSASEEALSAVVGMPLEQALMRLVELSLIEVYKNGEETRYGLHPLIRVFVGSKLKDVPDWEQEARKRWLEWWLSFTKAHGGPDGMEWAEEYDLIEREWENIWVACEWCMAHEQYEILQAFWHSERLLWITSIYGCWKERLFWLQRIGEAALRRGDEAIVIWTRVEQGFTLTQMGRVDEAEKALREAWEQRHLVDMEVRLALTENLVQWHIRTSNFAEAHCWLEEADQLVENPSLSESERPRHKLIIKYYYGVMHIARGDRARAERFFNETFDGAHQINWQRCMIYAQQFLADVAKAQGLFDKAEGLLKTGLEVIERNKDKRRIAYYKRSLAYLSLQIWRRNNERNKLSEAIEWAKQALDGFERLGMQREVNKLHRLLGRIASAPLFSMEDVLQEQTEVYPLMA
jgi:tetratricopeptide (TPR) repeat protein